MVKNTVSVSLQDAYTRLERGLTITSETVMEMTRVISSLQTSIHDANKRIKKLEDERQN